MRDPDLGIRLYSPWFNNYHGNTRVENAAVLSIEGYFIKNREEQFIRRYRRIIYPDGEWKVFVNQDGTYTSQEITYTQTPEGLSRTIITHG